MTADCFYGLQHFSSKESATCAESNHFIHQWNAAVLRENAAGVFCECSSPNRLAWDTGIPDIWRREGRPDYCVPEWSSFHYAFKYLVQGFLQVSLVWLICTITWIKKKKKIFPSLALLFLFPPSYLRKLNPTPTGSVVRLNSKDEPHNHWRWIR